MDVYTAEEITEMADIWANDQSFTGETCGKCKKTANVFAGGAEWFCDCGHYNVQSFGSFNMPHNFPDMGTPSKVIKLGYENSSKLKALL